MKRIFFILTLIYSTIFCYAQEYDSLVEVSRELRKNGQYDKAIQNYQYLIQSDSIDQYQLAYLYNILGISYSKLGDKPSLLKYYYEAIKLNKILNDSEGLAKNYLNISGYFRKEGQIDKAIAYLNQAAEYVSDQESLIYGRIMASLGQNYEELIEEDKLHADTASLFYLKAIKIFRNNNSLRDEAIINNDLAIMYKSLENYSLAKDYYQRSMLLADSINYNSLLVNTIRNLGIIYMEEKEYSKAHSIFNRSLSLANNVRDPDFYMDIYYNLIQANMALGQVNEASIFFEKFTELRDSIYDADKMDKLKEMETKYETELKEQELKAQEKTIASTVFEKNIFLSLSILLLLLIGLSIWFFNQKQKYLKKLKNEEIENMKKAQELKELNAMMHGQEEERNRIASDLHDRLGARLSSIKLLFQGKEGDSTINNDLISHIDEAIKETREISHNLSTDILTRFGVETALKDMMRTLEESGKISTELIIYGLETRWPLEIERNVYFILLELINNTLKHAQAASITIQISQIDGEVNVFYEDDGQGFDTMKSTGDGLGLRSLQARIGTIGGNIELNSQLGKGIQAVITFETILKEAIKEN